jgi:hypothetical protein
MEKLNDLSKVADWPVKREDTRFIGYAQRDRVAFTEDNFDFLIKNYSELVNRVNDLTEILKQISKNSG